MGYRGNDWEVQNETGDVTGYETMGNGQATPSKLRQVAGRLRGPTGVLRSQGTMPTGVEPGLSGWGGGEPNENVQNLGREMDTTEGNLRDNRRVNFRDTAMGSRGPDGNV
eukprot:s2837_g11.t1